MRLVALLLVASCARPATPVRPTPHYEPVYTEVTGTWVTVPYCDGIPLVNARGVVEGCLREGKR